MSKIRVEELETLDGSVTHRVEDLASETELNRRVIYLDTIADLLALDTNALVDGQQVYVKEYHSGTGVGGGVFYWDASSTSPDNAGTVFKVVGVTTGRWARQTSDPMSPKEFGAIGDGESHPLSGYFSTLEEAQGVYPHATALTDEMDWAACQSQAEYLYNRQENIVTGIPSTDNRNWSVGTVLVDGDFVVNKTITYNVHTLVIKGNNEGERVASYLVGRSSFRYNGPDGTVDQPIWIIDTYTRDEFGNPPTGKVGNPIDRGNTSISRVRFIGKNGSLTGMIGDESGYISGVRIRPREFCKIRYCSFSGSLWDGINFTGQQLFTEIRGCHFYGIYRDCIAVHRAIADFSTTMWIYENEIANFGRYGIFGDFRGSIEAMPIVRDNSIEGAFDGFHVMNNDWFVHGVVSSVCFIGANNLRYENNRHEANLGVNRISDLNVVDLQDANISKNLFKAMSFSSSDRNVEQTQALSDYINLYGYRDITNERNYNCGDASSARRGSREITIDGMQNMGIIYLVGGSDAIFFPSSDNQIINQTDRIYISSIDVIQGTYSKKIAQPPAITGKLDTLPISTYYYRAAICTTRQGGRYYIAGDYSESKLRLVKSTAYTWEAETTYTNEINTISNFAKTLIYPTIYNGYVYQCVQSGETGATEPAWPTTIGLTVTDGTVIWECIGNAYADEQDGKRCSISYGKLISGGGAPPTTGYYNRGDKVYDTNPTAVGQPVGWVCVGPGIPGNWEPFGTIG